MYIYTIAEKDVTERKQTKKKKKRKEKRVDIGKER